MVMNRIKWTAYARIQSSHPGIPPLLLGPFSLSSNFFSLAVPVLGFCNGDVPSFRLIVSTAGQAYALRPPPYSAPGASPR